VTRGGIQSGTFQILAQYSKGPSFEPDCFHRINITKITWSREEGILPKRHVYKIYLRQWTMSSIVFLQDLCRKTFSYCRRLVRGNAPIACRDKQLRVSVIMPRNKKHVRVFSWQESGDYVVRQRLCTIQITFDLSRSHRASMKYPKNQTHAESEPYNSACCSGSKLLQDKGLHGPCGCLSEWQA